MTGTKGDSVGKRLSNTEKRWFPWRRNHIVKGKPVFFPGCNLVNFLPATAQKAIEAVQSCGGGWLYDCCGKPLAYSKDNNGVEAVSERVRRALEEANVLELITACPNCFHQFNKTLSMPVKDIYTFLKEQGVPCRTTPSTIALFQSCPDRRKGEWVHSIAEWTGAEVEPQKGLPCCGLAMKDPAKARAAVEVIRNSGKPLTTCCASCTGQLYRGSVAQGPHILTAGLGIAEKPAGGMTLALNRMRPMGW